MCGVYMPLLTILLLFWLNTHLFLDQLAFGIKEFLVKDLTALSLHLRCEMMRAKEILTGASIPSMLEVMQLYCSSSPLPCPSFTKQCRRLLQNDSRFTLISEPGPCRNTTLNVTHQMEKIRCQGRAAL